VSKLGRSYTQVARIVTIPEEALAAAGPGGTPGTGIAELSVLSGGSWVPAVQLAFLAAGSWQSAGLYTLIGGTWG